MSLERLRVMFSDDQSVPAPVLVALLALVGWLGASVVLRRRKRDYPQYLPSPPKVLPTWMGKLGGHMLALRKGKMQQQFEDWADEFGGSYELFMFGTRRIIVVDPAETRRLLALRPATFGRGASAGFIDMAGRAVGLIPGLFLDDDASWGRSRRLVAPAFNAHNVRNMVPAVAKIAERLCHKWSAAADGDGIVDAKEDLGRFTHDVIALVGFRHEAQAISAADVDFRTTYAVLTNMFADLMDLIMSPFRRIVYTWLPFHPWVRRIQRDKAIVKTLVQDLCRNERHLLALEKGQRSLKSTTDATTTAQPSTKDNPSEGLLLRKLVEAGDGGGGRGKEGRLMMPDDDIVTQARSLFIAGQETTSLTLAWSAYFLAKHPHMQARCREEAMKYVSSSNGVAKTFEETTSLVYAAAVFKETLRLKTAVPTLGFWAKEDYTMLDGSTYPKGTSVVAMFRYMATREDSFTRAKDFIPERWIEAEREEALLGKATVEGNDGPRAVNHVLEAFLPFGAGPRVCPGAGMAQLEGTIMIAALCVQFDIALAPGQADPPEDRFVLTAGPADIKLKLTKRKLA